MSKATIRDYRPEDRAAVRRICFETGMMGDTIAPQYSDEESFADMVTAYFTDKEPESAVVAEMDGQVVGYMLSCRDARKVWDPGGIALRHAITRLLPFRPGTAAFYWRGLWDMVVDLFRNKKPKIDLEKYPSQTHNNLLAHARGSSAGAEFFFHIFDKLKRAGSPGVHGEALAENTNMIEFATKKLGYVLVGEKYPIPGLRMPNGERVWMRIAVRDLTNWEPGSWMKPKKPKPAEPPAG